MDNSNSANEENNKDLVYKYYFGAGQNRYQPYSGDFYQQSYNNKNVLCGLNNQIDNSIIEKNSFSSLTVQPSLQGRFFVIKSVDEDNVHKVDI